MHSRLRGPKRRHLLTRQGWIEEVEERNSCRGGATVYRLSMLPEEKEVRRMYCLETLECTKTTGGRREDRNR